MGDVKLTLNPDRINRSPQTTGLSSDLHVITEEILSYKQRVTSSIIEIGKRLKHVKENDLAHGKWLDWLRSVEIEPRTAQRFMQAYEQFGNTSASTQLEAGKIIEMLPLPPEVDRAEFIAKKHVVPSTGEEKAVAEMTTRELREVVKEQRKAAGLVKEKKPVEPAQAPRQPSVPLFVEIEDDDEDVSPADAQTADVRAELKQISDRILELATLLERDGTSEETRKELLAGILDVFICAAYPLDEFHRDTTARVLAEMGYTEMFKPKQDVLNPWQILGVREGAPMEEVTAQFRKLTAALQGSTYLLHLVTGAYGHITGRLTDKTA